VADDSKHDGNVTAADVLAGDKVVVKARLPHNAVGAQPFDASSWSSDPQRRLPDRLAKGR